HHVAQLGAIFICCLGLHKVMSHRAIEVDYSPLNQAHNGGCRSGYLWYRSHVEEVRDLGRYTACISMMSVCFLENHFSPLSYQYYSTWSGTLTNPFLDNRINSTFQFCSVDTQSFRIRVP